GRQTSHKLLKARNRRLPYRSDAGVINFPPMDGNALVRVDDSSGLALGPARTIIYLEDNHLVREGIATMLRFAGYRVVDFASVTDVLAAFNDLLNPAHGPVPSTFC
ncbi:MAG: hypothetical protein O2881_02200, partial [Proteobacteria bacterium]|nr:hypothetical protein [Pseudomonadota bacterium]